MSWFHVVLNFMTKHDTTCFAVIWNYMMREWIIVYSVLWDSHLDHEQLCICFAWNKMEQITHNSARHLKKVHTVWYLSLKELTTNSPQEIVCVYMCVFIKSCQTIEEMFFPVSASVCLCQTLCVFLAGHFDLVFGIQGFVEVGNESKVAMSVCQNKRFIVLTFWVEKRKSLSCILIGFCLLAY